MIKINLIPYRAERRKEQIRFQLTVAGMSFLPILIAIVISYLIIHSKLTGVEEDIKRTRQAITKQKVSIQKIKKYKKAERALLKKLEIIEKLQKGKTGPVHIMEELAVNLPGALWLTSLEQKGMTMKIEGTSLGDQWISQYMINLQHSSYFKNVDLLKIKARPKNSKLKGFTLNCQISYRGIESKNAKDRP